MQRKWFYRISISVIVSLLLFCLVLKLSPVMAKSITKMLGIDEIVSSFQFEKQHPKMEKVVLVNEKETATLTIEYAIADPDGIKFFYILKGNKDIVKNGLQEVNIAQHNRIIAGSTVMKGSLTEENVYEGSIDFLATETNAFKNETFNVSVSLNDANKTSFTSNIRFTSGFYEKAKIIKQKAFFINEQRITVAALTATPLRTTLHLKTDKNAHSQLLTIGKFRFKDENNEAVLTEANLRSMKGALIKGEATYYFNTPNDTTTSHGVLKLQQLQTIPAKQSFIVADLKKRNVFNNVQNERVSITVEHENIIFKEKIKTNVAPASIYRIVDDVGENIPYTTKRLQQKNELTTIYKIDGTYKGQLKLYYDAFPHYVDKQVTLQY